MQAITQRALSFKWFNSQTLCHLGERFSWSLFLVHSLHQISTCLILWVLKYSWSKTITFPSQLLRVFPQTVQIGQTNEKSSYFFKRVIYYIWFFIHFKKDEPFIKKRTFKVHFLMVEMKGLAPFSKNNFQYVSTSLVYSIKIPETEYTNFPIFWRCYSFWKLVIFSKYSLFNHAMLFAQTGK